MISDFYSMLIHPHFHYVCLCVCKQFWKKFQLAPKYCKITDLRDVILILVLFCFCEYHSFSVKIPEFQWIKWQIAWTVNNKQRLQIMMPTTNRFSIPKYTYFLVVRAFQTPNQAVSVSSLLLGLMHVRKVCLSGIWQRKRWR